MATQQIDLKRILAFTTISALGMLVMMIGIGTTLAIQGALVFVLAHALYKGTLFLVAGNIDHQTRTRDVNHLTGLGNVMPFTAAAAFLACASMAGILPFINFIGKEMIYEATLHSPLYKWVLFAGAFITSTFFVAVALQLSTGVFLGQHDPIFKKTKEAYPGMLIAPLVLSGLGLVTGLWPQQLAQPLLQVAANNMVNRTEPLELSLWHGFNLIFILSVVTLVVGFIFYQFRIIIQRLPPEHDFLQQYGPAQFYEKGLKGLNKLAVLSTRFFQHGRLPDYAATLAGVFCAFMLTTLIKKQIPFGATTIVAQAGDFLFYELITLILIPVVLFIVLRSKSRLTSLAVMGVVGYAVALIFILFGAPDVAITQFLIETLTVVLFVLVMHRLPVFFPVTPRFKNVVHALVALLFGGLIIFLLLLVTSYPLDPGLKNYFAENSYTLGKGKNVVNVILVDFRALDTLGEITVLGIVAIGIFALLRLRLPQEGEEKP